MSLKVIEFYKKSSGTMPFTVLLKDPTFYILVKNNDKIRELELKLSGEFNYLLPDGMRDFKEEAFKDYFIIVSALLGENKELIKKSFRLEDEEYRELIFGLYFVLIRNYSTCNWFKKGLLFLTGFFKFVFGRIK